ncbi:MAG: sugar phosphate nucleotidyltransferase [Kiritimatiellae bacterium]|nr:sugar phosphate nucleotidyltransferase [Kiritimatiellia bacterium]MDD5520133.1 sugar phosphate nucleotidyltransferase [Kiritimatiellia bacterium]
MKNSKPEKAILLAAGLGTRIQPLSDDLPKPMMPIWGKPAVLHMINLMERFGVHEILINLHHNSEPILEYFRNNPVKGMQIEFSYEPEILGTGGALKKASWFIDSSPFWLANTDIVADLSPEPFLQEFNREKPLAVVWLHPTLGPRTVEMTRNRITCFQSKKAGGDNTFTFCGLHLLSRNILKYLPEPAFSSIINAYLSAMSKGKTISGVISDNSFWADIGNPSQYLEAHRMIFENYRQKKPGARLFDPEQLKIMDSLRRRGIMINGFAAISSNSIINRGANISDSIIWDKAQITSSAALDGAIVARNTRVYGPVSGMAIRCEKIIGNKLLKKILNKISWPTNETTAIVLGARGSARSFTRLLYEGKSVIYIHYSPEREENIHYAEIARFLRKETIPVPKVLVDSPEHCTTIMEDLGDCHLESAVKAMDEKQCEVYYKRVLDALLVLHAIPHQHIKRYQIELQPPFSIKLYRWERALMSEHFLSKQLKLDKGTIHKIMNDLEIAAGKLLTATPVLLHRDMQSSNILIKNKRPFLIDFQGLRFGPAAYDVASLLCDPYVMLSPALQDRLLNYYTSRSARGKEVEGLYWYAAVERLAQVLGAFGRLSSLPGTERFARYFSPAIQMMSRALTHLNGLYALKSLVSHYKLTIPPSYAASADSARQQL